MNLLTLLFFVNIIMEAGKLISTTASTKDMIPYVIINFTYLVTGVGYAVYFFKSKMKDAIKAITLGTSVYIMFFISYWEMLLIL